LRDFKMMHKIVRLPEVKNATGLSRSSIYLRMSNSEFPRSISLGGRAVGWFEEDIQNWLEQKRRESQGEG
jgi:prophage regulatory protein